MKDNVVPLKTFNPQTNTRFDTIELTPSVIASWKKPPFQRTLRVNDGVRELVDQLRQDGGVIPGVIHLGVLGRDTYLLDGQHRIHAFILAELKVGYVDVRVHQFHDMGEMGIEFVHLNGHIVNLRPDDILQGFEEATPALRYIRQKCPYVGYAMIRRGNNSPLLSMSMLLRCWDGSKSEAPKNCSVSSLRLAQVVNEEDSEELCVALALLYKAWGSHQEYHRLWSTLNLTLCLWLYRRIVLTKYSAKSSQISKDLFLKAMMSLSADPLYIDWLLGRHLNDRDRSPAYSKLKSIIVRRVEAETGKRPLLPHPTWAS